MILREEGPFCRIETQVRAPVVDSITRLEDFSGGLSVASGQHWQQERHYQQEPCLHRRSILSNLSDQSNSGNWKSLLLLLPLIRM